MGQFPGGAAPSMDAIRKAINQIALEDEVWAGAPLPVHDLPLVIEPRYPYAKLNGYCLGQAPPTDTPPSESENSIRVINSWFSLRIWAWVYICDDGPDTPRFSITRSATSENRLNLWINTIGASVAWDMSAEIRALENLRSLVSNYVFERYFLTGTFLETSKKSRVTYLFRKLRPTVAITQQRDGAAVYLTSLCLHPIGHYQNSWGGVMCPTDDVIASLLLMRADEHYFWRKANHHRVWESGAGI